MKPTRTAPARHSPGAVLLAAAGALLWGCQMEWGGASVAVRDPSPPDTAGDAADAGPEVPPLPEGPVVLLARLDDDGSARAVPVARLGARGLEPLGWPSDAPPAYRDAFVRAFQAAGDQLPLHAQGVRAGALILGQSEGPVNAGCPAVSAGQALLPPGSDAPSHAFAVAGDGEPPPPARPTPDSTTRRLRLFAPILAERILREQGVERAFLARQADLRPVAFPGDTAPGMAATYLINDSLAAAPPPSGGSVSLFFLARFAPAEGFVPTWTRVRRYTEPEGKETLAHLGWLETGTGRVDLLRRVDAEREVLVALTPADGGRREVVELAAGGCPLLAGLRPRTSAAPAQAPPAGSPEGPGP